MKSFIAKALALAVSSLVALAFCEAAVRIVVPQDLSIWSHTRDGIVIHQSNVEAHMTPDGKRIDTNSVGMRDSEHVREKEPGTTRILLMGDSFMEAVQVNWDDTLAARLTAHLNARPGVRVEVINAAVSGWGTDHQRAYYDRYARDWQPDLILLGMTLHNDLVDNLAMKYSTFEAGVLEQRPREFFSSPVYTRMLITEWLAGHSHLYRLITGTLHAEAVRAGGQQLQRDLAELVSETPSKRMRVGWAMTDQLIDQFNDQARADGAKLAVFMIPLLIQVEPVHYEGYVQALQLDPTLLDLDGPQARIKAIGNAHGVPVIDLLPVFRSTAEQSDALLYLTDDGHWNEAGHALAARLVAEALVEQGLVPAPPVPAPPKETTR